MGVDFVMDLISSLAVGNAISAGHDAGDAFDLWLELNVSIAHFEPRVSFTYEITGPTRYASLTFFVDGFRVGTYRTSGDENTVTHSIDVPSHMSEMDAASHALTWNFHKLEFAVLEHCSSCWFDYLFISLFLLRYYQSPGFGRIVRRNVCQDYCRASEISRGRYSAEVC